MRLLVTADLHYNHAKSRPLAENLIDRMNEAGGDVLLVVGDTATGDTDSLEQCLSRFRFDGPKLFVAGNHELWTAGPDSYRLFVDDLPRRVREVGWRWMQTDPFVAGRTAIVGSVGWYDYSFAQSDLGIPLRFYEHKMAPGSAARYENLAHLFTPSDDIAPAAHDVFARWNDGRFVKLHQSDREFLGELLAGLSGQLDALASMRTVVAAVHHLPFRELLPPPHNAQWDFAKAYLGSAAVGELLLRHPNVRHLFCGHSHLPMEARVGPIHAVNIGSGYRWKTFHTLDIPD